MENKDLWFGAIPPHWTYDKIGILFSERRTKVSDKDYAPLSVARIGVVPQLATAVKTDAGDNRKLVCNGDFVINSRSDRKGSCGVADRDGSVSLINIVLTPRNEWNNRYVHYLMRSQPFSEEYYRYGRGIVADLWTTRYSEMKSILLPIPPRTEQDQIVRFLDWKVSVINRLIGIKQRQIERLEEIKKVVISKVVTRGLHDNMSVYWPIIPMKRCLKNISDLDHYMPPSVDDGIPYLMTGDLKKTISAIKLDNCKQISEESYEMLSQKSKPHIGDVIFARYATIGTVCYVDIETPFLVSYSCLTLSPNKLIQGKYIYYYLQSDVFSNDIRKYIKINTQGNIGKESIKQASIILPPLDKQEEIIKYLDRITLEFDTIIQCKNEQSTKLKELKTRLIADAVTGKIDVRNIEIPDYEFVGEELQTEEEIAAEGSENEE